MATLKLGINLKAFRDSDFIVKLFINFHQFQAMIKSFKNIASSIREQVRGAFISDNGDKTVHRILSR